MDHRDGGAPTATTRYRNLTQVTRPVDQRDRRAMLVGMPERRQAEMPWAAAPLWARILVAVIVAVPAYLMGASLASARGVVIGAILGLFWGALAILVIVFPATAQRWSRQRPLFTPILTCGVLLFGLLFLTTMPTPIAVFFAIFIAIIIGIIAVQRRRKPTTPPPPVRGRRHS
jgi:hypothetical protein